MKREEFINSNYIDRLISLCCRFYLPLNTDYTDVIGNNTGTVAGSVGSFDNDKGLRFTGNGGLYFPNTVFNWLGYNQSFTALVDFYLMQPPGNFAKMFVFVPNSNVLAMEKGLSFSIPDGNLIYAHMCEGSYVNAFGNTGYSYNAQYNKFGLAYDGSTHVFHIIENGIISQSSNTCSSWTSGYTNLYIGRVQYNSGLFNGYIRNLMVFDKALTQQEINKL